MVINVFIPTYRRLKSLNAVLYSLIKNNNLSLDYTLKCYIVNNYPPNKPDVDTIAMRYNQMQSLWKVTVIHREKTLPPVENWYSAIREFTNDGDIAFLQGDDDLFLPDSISYRVNTILAENADLLLTKHIGGILFHDNSHNISVENFKWNLTPEKLNQVNWSDDKWSAIFIGNNTYRMSPKLREAFDKGMDWCNEQNWLEYDQRTLMYPLYIPIALIFLQGKVVQSNRDCVIRSMNIDECRRALWGVPGWNSGFLHWAFLGVLANNDLKNIKELTRDRNHANNYVAHWYFTFWFDHRIPKALRKKMIALIGRPKFRFNTIKSGMIFLTKGFLSKVALYNKMVDLKKKRNPNVVVETFINQLYQ